MQACKEVQSCNLNPYLFIIFCNAVPVTEVKIKDKDSERGNKRKATNVSLDPLYALGNSGSQLEGEQIFSEIGGFFSTPETTNKIKCSVSKFDFLHFAQIWEGHVFDWVFYASLESRCQYEINQIYIFYVNPKCQFQAILESAKSAIGGSEEKFAWMFQCVEVDGHRNSTSSSYQSSSISSSWNACLDIWIFRCVDGHGTKIRRKLTKPDFKIHCVEVGNQMRCTNVSCNFLHLRPSQPSIEGPCFINGQIGFQLLSHSSSKNKRNAPKKKWNDMTMFESAVVAWKKQ